MTKHACPAQHQVATMLSDREVLARMIEYAKREAEGEGQRTCAMFLSAALLALELDGEEAEAWLRDSHDRPALLS